MALTPTTSIPLGFQAPSFTLPDARTGDALNSDELMQGGPSVVVFMCNHCPFVVHLVDSLVDFAAEYQARGLNFIAISSNDVENYPQDGFEQMRELATEKGFTFPYLYDESQDVARLRCGVHARLQRVRRQREMRLSRSVRRIASRQ